MIDSLARLLLLLPALLGALPATAVAQDYIAPKWPDLLHTLVRFKAIDLGDEALIDEYAAVTECPLFQTFYSDDFKWNQARSALRESARLNAAGFPVSYGVIAALRLDRYDFDEKAYRLTDDTAVRNVNSFVLFAYHNPPCKDVEPKNLPRVYRAVLDTPVNLSGMPITQKDGEALLRRMRAAGNDSRTVFGRFNLTVVFVEPWKRQENADKTLNGMKYGQAHSADFQAIRLDARLDSVDFFEDQGLTQLIYEAKP